MFNVGKHTTCVQLEKVLTANGVEFKKAKKPYSVPHALLSFEVSEQAIRRVTSFVLYCW